MSFRDFKKHVQDLSEPGNARSLITSSKGFTLMEALIALLILVMVATIVATGVPSAFKSYRAAVDGSNAQVVMSSTVAKLRDELSYATDVKTDDDNRVLYYLSDDAHWMSIDQDDTHHGLIRRVYSGDGESLSETDDSPMPLLPEASLTEYLEVQFNDDDNSGIYYEDGIFSVNGLEVLYVGTQQPVLSFDDITENSYKIRSLSIKDV